MGKRKAKCKRKGAGGLHGNRKSVKVDKEGPMDDLTENEDSSVSVALRIPLILHEILKQLPTSDVLKCCLVNKQWCGEARKVLRDWKVCPFRTRPESACQDLKVLESMLPTLNTVHFNGLSINVDENKHDHCGGLLMEMFELCKSIPSLLRVKHLEINWQGRELGRICPAIKLVIFILLQKPSTSNLEYLYLKNLKEIMPLYNREDISKGVISLPRLKILKTDMESKLPPGIIEDLVSVSPNLKELQIDLLSAKHLDWLPQQKYHIVRGLEFNIFQRNNEERCYAFAQGKPKLQNLCISPPEDFVDEEQLDELNIRKWLETLRLLFENSSPILEFLDVDALTLTILMRLPGIPPAEKLKTLCVLWDFGSAYSPVRARLKNLPFSQVFPNVSHVRVQIVGPSSPPLRPLGMQRYVSSLRDGEEDLGDSTLPKPRKLEVSVLRPEKPAEYFESMIEDVAEVFSNISCLTVDCYDDWDSDDEFEDPQDVLEPLPYHKLWTNWADLEELEIREELYPNSSVNHDAEFCGIHPQEVRELQKKDENFLRAVHIVPIQPSITNLSRLRRLHLVLNGTIPPYKTRSHKPPYLSHVTGVLAFQRLPGLKVTIETPKIRGGLGHLASFVSSQF